MAKLENYLITVDAYKKLGAFYKKPLDDVGL